MKLHESLKQTGWVRWFSSSRRLTRSAAPSRSAEPFDRLKALSLIEGLTVEAPSLKAA